MSLESFYAWGRDVYRFGWDQFVVITTDKALLRHDPVGNEWRNRELFLPDAQCAKRLTGESQPPRAEEVVDLNQDQRWDHIGSKQADGESVNSVKEDGRIINAGNNSHEILIGLSPNVDHGS